MVEANDACRPCRGRNSTGAREARTRERRTLRGPRGAAQARPTAGSQEPLGRSQLIRKRGNAEMLVFMANTSISAFPHWRNLLCLNQFGDSSPTGVIAEIPAFLRFRPQGLT